VNENRHGRALHTVAASPIDQRALQLDNRCTVVGELLVARYLEEQAEVGSTVRILVIVAPPADEPTGVARFVEPGIDQDVICPVGPVGRPLTLADDRTDDLALCIQPRAEATGCCNYQYCQHPLRLHHGAPVAGLRYNENAIAAGAQTERRGLAGPV